MALLLTLAALAAPAPAAADLPPGCNTRACTERVKRRQARRKHERTWRNAPPAVRAHLRRISRCETGGTDNERIVSPSGQYRGLLQFSVATWRSVGGRGDPAAAERIEQWARGATLYQRSGPGQWPVCQYR